MADSVNHFEMRRLEALSNTIFGVAMTLLAYNLPKGTDSGWCASLVHNLGHIPVANRRASDQLYRCRHVLGFAPAQTGLPAIRNAPHPLSEPPLSAVDYPAARHHGSLRHIWQHGRYCRALLLPLDFACGGERHPLALCGTSREANQTWRLEWHSQPASLFWQRYSHWPPQKRISRNGYGTAPLRRQLSTDFSKGAKKTSNVTLLNAQMSELS